MNSLKETFSTLLRYWTPYAVKEKEIFPNEAMTAKAIERLGECDNSCAWFDIIGGFIPADQCPVHDTEESEAAALVFAEEARGIS